MLVHIALQVLGTFLVVVFLMIIVLSLQLWTTPHAVVGILVLCSIVLQILAGMVNRIRLSNKELDQRRAVIQNVHHYLGVTILFFGAVQVGLGIETLYPWVEREARGHCSLVNVHRTITHVDVCIWRNGALLSKEGSGQRGQAGTR